MSTSVFITQTDIDGSTHTHTTQQRTYTTPTKPSVAAPGLDEELIAEVLRTILYNSLEAHIMPGMGADKTHAIHIPLVEEKDEHGVKHKRRQHHKHI